MRYYGLSFRDAQQCRALAGRRPVEFAAAEPAVSAISGVFYHAPGMDNVGSISAAVARHSCAGPSLRRGITSPPELCDPGTNVLKSNEHRHAEPTLIALQAEQLRTDQSVCLGDQPVGVGFSTRAVMKRLTPRWYCTGERTNLSFCLRCFWREVISSCRLMTAVGRKQPVCFR